MTEVARPNALARWLRRHSLTLVAALGGASGVAYAAVHAGTSTASAPAPASTVGAAVQTQAPMPPPEPATPAELPRDSVQDVVQVALVLDTSSSMDGLINQARAHLWNMVDQLGKMTRVVDGKVRGVRVELALFEYGNDTISAKQGYIRRVLPLTTDLDQVSEKLNALFTNGGEEYAGQAIVTAVRSLKWSSDPDAMRFVFVAGNETFDQGAISAARAMKAAAARDINVQLIYCGDKEPTWAAAAALARSDLMTIDQNQVARHIPSPQDDEILQLGQALNATYMAYGEEGAVAMARQSTADAASAKMSKKVALERMQLKSKASYRNGNWDVVDASDGDAKFLEQTPDAQLPAELRGKTLEEKKQLVAKKAAERAALKAKIAKLEAERTRFLEAERAKSAQDDASALDTEVMKSARKIATKKGYKL